TRTGSASYPGCAASTRGRPCRTFEAGPGAVRFPRTDPPSAPLSGRREPKLPPRLPCSFLPLRCRRGGGNQRLPGEVKPVLPSVDVHGDQLAAIHVVLESLTNRQNYRLIAQADLLHPSN